jgi:hypothetical protein
MAVVRLSDAVVYDVYGSYVSVDNPEKTALMQSGIVRRSETFDTVARMGGKEGNIPFWQDIDPTLEPNYSNDDPADHAVPNKIDAGEMKYRKAFLNQGFSDMDLVQELAGSSPMQHIRNRFGTYWLRQWQRRLIATLVGILNDNVANDGSDMVVDISGLTGDDAVFGSDAFIDAAYTAGDAAEQFVGIGVHSSIMARMLKNDEIVYLPDSDGALTIPTYKGRYVIVDDSMPVSSGVYTSILFGAGSFAFGGVEGTAVAYGEGVPRTPFEIDRAPTAGNGGGQETIWERRTWLLHPFGFSWVEAGAALADFSPSLADLRLAAHWNRVVPRKSAPFAFIKSRANPV